MLTPLPSYIGKNDVNLHVKPYEFSGIPENYEPEENGSRRGLEGRDGAGAAACFFSE